MSNAKQLATEIVRTLRQRGHQAYFAGGCVRDLLLGREPADYDVATDATPPQVMRIFPQTFAVGEQFGVVLVPFHTDATKDTKEHEGDEPARTDSFEGRALPGAMGGSLKQRYLSLPTSLQKSVEVATFRSDVGYSDGRHPDQVRFTKDPRQDVERRDFTINGMMLDPETNDRNPFGFCRRPRRSEGRDHPRHRRSHRRLAEDKLRMLRAVRFAARFDYQIEPATMAAIQKFAPQIQQVSRERVREELTKMLTEGRARQAFELLDTTGLLLEVLPEIAAMKAVGQSPQHHPEGDVFVHTLLLLEKLPAGCSKTLAWGALLHDVGKPPTFRIAPDRIRFDGHVDVGVKMAAEVCRRLRFSNHETGQILALIDNHMRFGDVQRMKQSTLKKFLRLSAFDEHLELHRLDCLSSHGNLDSYEYSREQLRSIPPEAIRPTPLITGRDLIAAGYQPGPRFKEILTAIEDAQLEGRITSHDAALKLLARQFPLP